MRRSIFRVSVFAAAATFLVLSWMVSACRREARAPSAEEDATPRGMSPEAAPSAAPPAAPPATEDTVPASPPESVSVDAAEAPDEAVVPDLAASPPRRPVPFGSPPPLPRSPSLRPLAPATGTIVHVRRPVLRWEVPADAGPARVELFGPTDWSAVRETLTSATGEAAPAEDLPPGRFFWRVRTDETAGAVWMFEVRPTPGEPVQRFPGDLTGDRYADFFVGLWAGLKPSDEALLFAGSADGVASTDRGTFSGNVARGQLMQGVHLVRGDVNGDGRPDLLTGTTVLLGDDRGVRPDASPATLEDETNEAHQGTLADVNGDGYDDVVRVLNGRFVGGSLLKKITVHFGGPSGPSKAAGSVLDPPEAEAVDLGTDVARAGDVNGDGCDDVFVLGRDPGPSAGGNKPWRPQLWLGGPDGLSLDRRLDLPRNGDVPLSAGGDRGPAWVTDWIVAEGPGDLDGDGFDDLVVEEDTRSGGLPFYVLRVFRGGPGELTQPSAPVEERQLGVVASAGDVDGDGRAEIVLAGYRQLQLRHGADLSDVETLELPCSTATGPGDLDGDGYEDLVVTIEDNEARVYYGGPDGTLSGEPDEILRRGNPRSDELVFASWVN